MAGRLLPFDFWNSRGRWGDGPWDLWSDPWNFDFDVPRRLFDQHFGLGVLDQDLFPPEVHRGMVYRPRRHPKQQASGMSEVANTDKEFSVCLDVSHFRPDEITIKSVGNKVVIHGKHEEKQDEHGFIQREFRRTYVLPTDVDADALKSSLSGDGILAICAPKKAAEQPAERAIPIEKMDTESSPKS